MLPNHLFILTINIILYIKNISKINYLHNNIYWSKSNNSKYKLKIKKIGKTFEFENIYIEDRKYWRYYCYTMPVAWKDKLIVVQLIKKQTFRRKKTNIKMIHDISPTDKHLFLYNNIISNILNITLIRL